MTALTVENGFGGLVERFGAMQLPSGKGFMNAVHAFPMLTEEEETALANDYRANGNKDAAGMLVCAHLRLVAAIARRFMGYGLPQEDLVAEGNIGLATAVDRFDPERKVRLGTYATHWIRAAIGEYVIRNFRMLKVATTAAQRKLFYRLRTIAGNLGRRLTKDDARTIAKELEVRPTDVLEMEKRMLVPEVPFESTRIGDDEFDNSPSATLAADGGAHAEVSLVEASVAQVKGRALAAALDRLDDRERLVVKARALSPSGKDVKLHTLAVKLGVSVERVRQLEKRALKKIEGHVLAATSHLFD